MAVPVPKGPEFGRTRRTRRTLVLAVVFVVYLVVGGVVFHFLETYSKTVTVVQPGSAWRPLLGYLQSNSTEQRRLVPQWPELKQTAVAQCPPASRQHVEEVLESLHTPAEEAGEAEEEEGVLATLRNPVEDDTLNELLLLCGNKSYELLSEEQEVPWSFIDATFFCMTVVTTIGYGHISPRSPGGQIFCIIYSLLGIPISGLLLAGLSDFFAGRLLNFYDTKWAKRYGDSKWSLAAFTVLYLLVGFLTFVFVPAIIFSLLEDWNYREAVYYSFITLSTIGFGDFTAAISDDTAWTSVYKVVVMVWILVGLSYWVLVLNFLQKTLKSKEVLETLKSTSRLIVKEADELRAALAELGFMHRDATFIPEHSKMALSMMLSMSRTLAGTTPSDSVDGEGTAELPAGLRGIHSIGSNMRSHGLLAALMASLPPPSSPAQTATPTTSSTATPTTTATLTLTALVAAGAEDQLEGRVNEGYLSDDTSEQVSSPASSSGRRPQTETETETEPETETDGGLVMTVKESCGAQMEGHDGASTAAASAGCGV